MRLEIWQADWDKTTREQRFDGTMPFDTYRCVFASGSLSEAVAEDVYYHFNRGTGGYLDALDQKIKGGYPMRSLSVGDIIVKGEKVLRCESIGWSNITKEWQKHTITKPYTNGFCETCAHEFYLFDEKSLCRKFKLDAHNNLECSAVLECSAYKKAALAVIGEEIDFTKEELNKAEVVAVKWATQLEDYQSGESELFATKEMAYKRKVQLSRLQRALKKWPTGLANMKDVSIIQMALRD